MSDNAITPSVSAIGKRLRFIYLVFSRFGGTKTAPWGNVEIAEAAFADGGLRHSSVWSGACDAATVSLGPGCYRPGARIKLSSS
jgi:hypothetical protein